jgi:hypothetical protein
LSPRGGCENFEILDGRRCNLGIYLRKLKLLIGLKNAGFLGWIFVPLKDKLKKSKLQSKCHNIRTDWQCLVVHFQQWNMMIFFSVLPQGHTLTSWHRVFFIHYRISVTFNTFQFRDDSESKSVINKTLCSHRLHWFKKIKSDLLFSNVEWNYNREQEKSKYLDNISVLPTSIFIFDKFVDGTQPEVAGEIAGCRHILRTLHYVYKHPTKY